MPRHTIGAAVLLAAALAAAQARAAEYDPRPTPPQPGDRAAEMRQRAAEARLAEAASAGDLEGVMALVQSVVVGADGEDGTSVSVTDLGGQHHVSGGGTVTSSVVVGRSVNVVVGKGVACTEIGSVAPEDPRCKRVGGVRPDER